MSGDTDRCQKIPSVTFHWGGFTAVRAFLPTCLLSLLGVLLSNPHQLDSLLPPTNNNYDENQRQFLLSLHHDYTYIKHLIHA